MSNCGSAPVKRLLQVADSRLGHVGTWTPAATRQDWVGYFDLLLASAIIATVFCLPLSESLKNIGYGIALVAYLSIVVVGGRAQMIVPPLSVLFLLSLAVAIASAFASVDQLQAWRGVWEVFRYTSFFFLVCRGIQGTKRVLAFLWAGVVGVGLAAILAVGRDLLFGFTIHRITMFSLGNKNAVAQYLVMMLAVMFGMADRLPVTRRGAATLGLAGGSSLILLGLSNARTR